MKTGAWLRTFDSIERARSGKAGRPKQPACHHCAGWGSAPAVRGIEWLRGLYPHRLPPNRLLQSMTDSSDYKRAWRQYKRQGRLWIALFILYVPAVIGSALLSLKFFHNPRPANGVGPVLIA